jgi:hypothetical protein
MIVVSSAHKQLCRARQPRYNELSHLASQHHHAVFTPRRAVPCRKELGVRPILFSDMYDREAEEEEEEEENPIDVPKVVPPSGRTPNPLAAAIVAAQAARADEELATPIPVILSTRDQRAAYEHDLQVRETLIRRRQWGELQYARFGIQTPFATMEDIRQAEEELASVEARLAKYEYISALLSKRAGILSVEQQRAAVLSLSRITGLSFDKIKLIDIVLGSVVLVVEMPIASAARLVAMQRLNHPMLPAQGFAKVALDQVVDIQGQPLDSLFERAVRFEEADLTAATPPSEAADHPYANIGGAARLRITLVDAAVQHE